MENRHMKIFGERMHTRSTNQLIAAWDAATPEERTELYLRRHFQFACLWRRHNPQPQLDMDPVEQL
jgi:hypothetical protein